MQLVDFTTLTAICTELRTEWIPSRIEQVYQRDRYTINIALRTLKKRSWLTISWHPLAARICMGDNPPKIPDTFTFSDQLRHQLNGLALINIAAIAQMERVLDLQFAKRPDDPIIWHLYIEIMGKYSNVILTGADDIIVTVAHQVSSQQSRVRPLQTGQVYELPPSLTSTIPSLNESEERWQERVSLIPGNLSKQLLKNYRGLSPALVHSMLNISGLNYSQSTDSLNPQDWHNLFITWQQWLKIISQLENNDLSSIKPGFTEEGYNVMGWGVIKPVESLQSLVNKYYSHKINQQEFNQLHHQLQEKIKSVLNKLILKETAHKSTLKQVEKADIYKEKADLLMAYLAEWKPGLKVISLPDFSTNELINIELEAEKNAIQNAQALYKRHQKLKRARNAVEPLLKEVQTEIYYLQQIAGNLEELEEQKNPEDLQTLQEIKAELINEKYLEKPHQNSVILLEESKPHRYFTPKGWEILIGRNNRQNDQLSFKTAKDYDLWFHTQEIPGSHCLLRIPPGEIPPKEDLQLLADLTAYYSQGRHSEQVPVIYTQPKYVYKPKGAKPGMVVYKHETVIWGNPHRGLDYILGN